MVAEFMFQMLIRNINRIFLAFLYETIIMYLFNVYEEKLSGIDSLHQLFQRITYEISFKYLRNAIPTDQRNYVAVN